MHLVMLGGTVLTMDEARPRATALAVEDGRITAVGATAEIATRVGPETEVVHLAGRCVAPGFIDPHNHFSMTTFEPVSVDCRIPPLDGKQGVLDAIAATAGDTLRGQWIWGLGYRARMGAVQAIAGPDPLTREELDEVAPDNPVCVMASSYHACFANSAALKLAGIDRDTPDPKGGEIRRDASGEPNGILWERAMDPVHRLSMTAHMDYYGEDTVADLVRQNAMRHLSHGITSVGDALVMPESAAIYRMADSRKKLPITVHQMRGGSGFFAEPHEAAAGAFIDEEVTDRLRGGTVKIFMDPVYPSTARTKFHPDGHHENFGERYYRQEEADQIVESVIEQGLQVAIHCLGTWAIEQALDALEPVMSRALAADLRPRIEHFSTATMAQIKRAASLGVIINPQPPFLYQSGPQAEVTRAENGIDAAQVPLRTMIDEGVMIAASSDFPCAPVEPLLGLYSIVSRKTRSGEGPVSPDEAISAMEGIRLYTMGSAYAMRRDHEVGSLEVGKRADMVVLSHDPTSVSPDYIREIVVQQTYVDGERLYEAV